MPEMRIDKLRGTEDWKRLIRVLRTFCRPLLARLDCLYHWDEPDSIPPRPVVFDAKLDWSSAKWNKQLKMRLNNAWHRGSHSQRLLLAKWVVNVWGGVRRNKESTIELYVQRVSKRKQRVPFGGISSYSKILSISNPNRYAIYDARVAASLNAIQLRAGSDPVVYFPIPAGQNDAVKRLAGDLPIKTSIAVRRDEAYSAYLEVLREVRTKMNQNCRLCELEMVLFAVAPRLSREARPPKIWSSHRLGQKKHRNN